MVINEVSDLPLCKVMVQTLFYHLDRVFIPLTKDGIIFVKLLIKRVFRSIYWIQVDCNKKQSESLTAQKIIWRCTYRQESFPLSLAQCVDCSRI